MKNETKYEVYTSWLYNSNGINTEIDLQRLQGQANSLHTQISEIQERRAQADRARQGDKSFLQLRQAQQMASMCARKKDELTAKLERLQEKKASLQVNTCVNASVNASVNACVRASFHCGGLWGLWCERI